MSAIGSAFSDEQYASAYPPGIERHWWTSARTAIVDVLLRETGGANDRILEIGCGTGVALAGLRARGHDCQGVELANVTPLDSVRDVVTTGRDAFSLPAHQRDAVNTILLLDVVEHLDDPLGFLRGLQGAFRALHRVVITVPAGRELWSNYDEFYGHHLRYDLAEVRAIGDACGWRATRLSYAFRISYPPARLLALLSLPRSVTIKAPHGAMTLVHDALAALTRWEWRLLPASLPGTSVVAVFETPPAARDT
jgi:SAM-dependent methyltransferase